MGGYILYSSLNQEREEKLRQLKTMTEKEEVMLQDCYMRLGKQCWQNYEKNPPEEFQSLISEISERRQKQEEYRGQMMKIKHAKQCPFCEAEIPADSVFCIMCGKKVAEQEEEKRDERTVVCRYCGTVLPAGSRFCAYCARSLDERQDDRYDIPENPEFRAGGAQEEDREEYEEAEPIYETCDSDPGINGDELYATMSADSAEDFPQICPGCSRPVRRGIRFCTACGRRLY